MSQGAINIEHSRAFAVYSAKPQPPVPSAAAPRKRKERGENGKMRADFRNLPRYNRNSAREECFSPSQRVRVSFARKLRILFSLLNSTQESRIQFVTI